MGPRDLNIFSFDFKRPTRSIHRGRLRDHSCTALAEHLQVYSAKLPCLHPDVLLRKSSDKPGIKGFRPLGSCGWSETGSTVTVTLTPPFHTSPRYAGPRYRSILHGAPNQPTTPHGLVTSFDFSPNGALPKWSGLRMMGAYRIGGLREW